MIEGEPSRTAWSAAMHRAAHQVVDGGRVFPDPVEVPITGWSPERILEDSLLHPQRRGMRAFIACRHRYARDVVAAQSDGAQVVVLGAGLDTTAYQPGPARHGTVFEVDHPATQAWKLGRLAAAGISATSARYVGVDFEHDDLTAALDTAGFDRTQASVVVWLGVTVYLTAPAVEATLAQLGTLTTARTDLVLDYSERDDGSGDGARRRMARAERVAALGEPWMTYFAPSEMGALLERLGFEEAEDLGLSGWGTRYLGLPPGRQDRPGGHLVHATRN
jgi:methyltransferase (TIGR00027 family)